MRNQKKEPKFIFNIQIEGNEPINIDFLPEEQKKKIGKKLYRNLIMGFGYEEIKK